MSYNFTHIREFKFWVQKVLPLTYDDSLSYLEVLAKVVEYLNTSIEELNKMGDAVEYLNNLGESWDARLKAIEDNMSAFQSDINAKIAEQDGKIEAQNIRIDAQDARIAAAIDELKIEIKAQLDLAKAELTQIINEQLSVFADMLEKNNGTLKRWVEDRLEEFKQDIPTFEDVIVVDPTTGELVDIQTALNHIYASGRVSFGALTVFEWIRMGLSWDDIRAHMVYSMPQGITIEQMNREARSLILKNWEKLHSVHDMISGLYNTVKSQINLLASITANAGSFTWGEIDTADIDIDTFTTYNKTCYNIAWNSNSWLGV